MLAPRKTLWSTPAAVVEWAIEWCGPLTEVDLVCDIGCGDGRCLLQWAQQYTTTLAYSSDTDKTCRSLASFVGIDIDSDRIQSARHAWSKAVQEGRIHPSIHVEFHCANALDAFEIFRQATVIFLYLIPRGLRKIMPLLEQIDHSIRVVTYMSPLPGVTPTRKDSVQVPHQPNAEWPVYAYDLNESKAAIMEGAKLA